VLNKGGGVLSNEKFNVNHYKSYTVNDLIYMCSMWENTSKRDIALALGKTTGALKTKANELRKSGQFEYFKSLGHTFLD